MFLISQEALWCSYVIVNKLICLYFSTQNLWKFHFSPIDFQITLESSDRIILPPLSYKCENTSARFFTSRRTHTGFKIFYFQQSKLYFYGNRTLCLQGMLTQSQMLVADSSLPFLFLMKIDVKMVRTKERSCNASQKKNICYFSCSSFFRTRW